MSESSGDKLCPICDSPLQPGSKKCGFCGTDLSIFDIENELPKEPAPVVVQAAPKPSVESRIEEIFSKPIIQDRPPVREQPKPAPAPVTEPVKPAPPPVPVSAPPREPIIPKKEEPKPEAPAKHAEYFECPECGSSVETTANSCPKCGVLFAEEGAEMFQCPACNTLVKVDATSCPGCGALFVEPEDAAARPPESKTEVALEVEEVKPALEPVKEEKRPEAEPEEAEPEEGEKKGFMRWFKRGKKEEAPEEEEKKEEEAKAEEKEKPKSWRERRKEKDKEEPSETETPEKEESPEPARSVPASTVRIEPTPVPAPKPSEVRIKEARPAPVIERPAPIREEIRPRPVPAPSHTPSPVVEVPISAKDKGVAEAPVPGKDKGRDLARMVAEMKPLLALAREKDVDIGESKQLIDDAATAGRERQLDKAIQLVQESKNMLMAKIDASLSDQIMKLNDEIKVAREFGGDISRAAVYIQEVAKARSAGDIEAAFVYADKVRSELLPITGRYNESRGKIAKTKQLISDCEAFIVDTREARKILVEANKAFDSKDFDKVDTAVKAANDSLAKVIPRRMNEEIISAKELLIDAKTRNINISPMITVLKSATNLMKAGDYAQAVKEMREFKEMVRKTK